MSSAWIASVFSLKQVQIASAENRVEVLAISFVYSSDRSHEAKSRESRKRFSGCSRQEARRTVRATTAASFRERRQRNLIGSEREQARKRYQIKANPNCLPCKLLSLNFLHTQIIKNVDPVNVCVFALNCRLTCRLNCRLNCCRLNC